MWFEKLTGFKETRPAHVRANISLEGNKMTSLVNGKTYQWGRLEVPSLKELRESISIPQESTSQIKVSEIVASVADLHHYPFNENAVFQAASQFNLLEMVGPEITPEMGVDRYAQDYTQGPACAIACGAGTIYRNYFAEVDGQVGQTRFNQIDCLEEIGKTLNNEELNLWKMSNGYALLNQNGLEHINNYIQNLSPIALESFIGQLKVGIQWDVEVTINPENRHCVHQVYCSALPVAYTRIEQDFWEPFARAILEGTYEATFYAAVANYLETNNDRLYLTLVGGGVFGNKLDWIKDAIQKSLVKFKHVPLDVRIVSYGSPNPALNSIIYMD